LLLASASCSWVISLSLSLSSLFFFFTHRTLRLPSPTLSTLILAWEDEAQWAVVRQAKRENKNGNEVETLVALESQPAIEREREKDRTDRCRPSAAAARQCLPTAGLLIKDWAPG
jgi:hypothetical protein